MKELEETIQENQKNEQEIRKCEIKINDNIIPFTYKYKFPKKGKYNTCYTFDNLTRSDYLFYDCTAHINIDCSHFETLKLDKLQI